MGISDKSTMEGNLLLSRHDWTNLRKAVFSTSLLPRVRPSFQARFASPSIPIGLWSLLRLLSASLPLLLFFFFFFFFFIGRIPSIQFPALLDKYVYPNCMRQLEAGWLMPFLTSYPKIVYCMDPDLDTYG